jgi:hypothetical protein
MLPVLLCLGGLFTACQLPANGVEQRCVVSSYLDTTGTPYQLPYDLKTPDTVLTMPNILKEISGLSMAEDGKTLVAIQDEEADIFWIDPVSGDILRQLDFWKDGDYEGIEFAEGNYYVVKNTGTIYQVHPELEKDEETIKYNTFLDKDYDVEGLAYDPEHRQLLLACKALAGKGDTFRMSRSVYAFDLEQKKLDPNPRFCIRLEQVNEYLATEPLIRKLEKLNDIFAPNQPEFGFSPSAMAQHPHSKNYYILSSVGKMLMILAPDGQILHIEKLKKSVHPQPEGICFNADGELFVANEGHGGDGLILKFNFSPQ